MVKQKGFWLFLATEFRVACDRNQCIQAECYRNKVDQKVIQVRHGIQSIVLSLGRSVQEPSRCKHAKVGVSKLR